MKHHQNRSGSKRRLLQAVFYKWYFKQYDQELRIRRRTRQNLAINVGAAMLLGSASLVWAKDENPKANVLPEVVVSGRQDKQKKNYKAEGISLGKFTEPLLDTPQSVSVVPKDLMSDQGVTTLRDAVRNVAGISIAAGEAGAQGDNLTLRGFSARNDIYLDGMRDFGSYYRDAFNYDRVEVLKGPSSIAFGRGSTGGVVNQVSKAPEKYREISGELTYGTNNKKRASIDINEPLPKIENAALRLNAFKENSNVSNRDVAENNHSGVAAALSLGMGTENRATFSYLHEEQNDTPDYGLPWLNDAPAHVRRENYYGFKGDNYLKTNADIVTVKAEHDFSDDFTLRDQVRFGHYTRHFRITEPQITNPNAAFESMIVNRNQLSGDSAETFLQNQLDLTSKFKTGFIDHTLVTGVESGRETSEPNRYTWAGVPTTSLITPNYDQPFSGTRTQTSKVYTTGDTLAFYTVDTLKLNEHWEVQGGLRWDRFNSRYKQSIAPATAFSRTDKMTSWRGALIYKPVDNGSIYFDYGTSFNPSAESLALSVATANIAPEENETYELGSKWDLFNKKMSVRGAIYETVKKNARETDPNNTLENVLAGQQNVQGLELEFVGHLTDPWQVYSGYTFMKSRLAKSNFFPSAVGSQLANVPENIFTLWSTYDLPGNLNKFQVGAGTNFVDSRTASSTAPYAANGVLKQLPSYWLFNSAVTYHFNKNVDFQMNFYNLANKVYYDQIHPSHVVPGEGRTVTLSSKFKF